MSGSTTFRGALAVAILTAAMAFSAPGLGAGAGVPLLEARVDLEDQASLQRGAKLFVNYCLSCHSSSFMRYNRLGRDLGLTPEQVKDNLLLAGEKVVDQMKVSMKDEDAARWFGNAPPDLSVIARARGADWLYTYLMTFYRDPDRPFGANNLAFPEVAMPHVLVELQGVQTLKPPPEGADGHAPMTVSQMLELESAGSMNPGEFRKAMRDLTSVLVYLAEPAKLERYQIGFWVLVFLAVFFYLSRKLYKEYWKDVH